MIWINTKEKEIKSAFNKVKQELNDHLESINQNTNEISTTNDYILHIENMLTKLNERMDLIELKINDLSKDNVQKKSAKNISLTPKEQEIFYFMYSRSGDLLGYRDISKSLGLTEQMTIKTISSISQKGVPIIKKEFDGRIYIMIEPEFVDLQAKENIVKF